MTADELEAVPTVPTVLTGRPLVRVAPGPRAVEAALVHELEPLVEAARRRPELLARPVIVLVPSRALREHVSALLLQAFGPALAGVRIQTLYAAALSILERCGAPPPPGPELFPVWVRRLARREPELARSLEGLVDGYGCVEASVADLLDAGFEAAHADALEELLADAAADEPLRARARALIRSAAALDVLLGDGALGHRSRVFREARTALERDAERALPAAGLWVHGFADVTGVQGDLVAALIRLRGARVLLDRPRDPETGEASATVEAFGRRFFDRVAGAAGGVESGAGESIDPPRVSVLLAPGQRAEVRAVVERLQRLVAEGAALERIAVVARDLTPYRLALRAQLDRAGVPYSGVGERGAVTPVGRRLAALLDLLERGPRTPAERWLEAAISLGGGKAVPAAARRPLGCGERAGLRLALHRQGAGRLEQVAQLALGDGAAGPTGADLMPAVLAARALCAAWSAWPDPASLAEHRDALRSLTEDALGWSDDGLDAAHANPGEPGLLRAALLDGPPLGPPELALTRAEFLSVLQRSLSARQTDALGGRGGGVQILSAAEARGRSFDHLFVIGLNRNLFPRVVSEDPLLPDSLRQALRVLLPDLPVKREGYAEERHLFAQLCAASPCLTLSCVVRDEDGRECAPSSLLEGLRRASHVPAAEALAPPLTLPGSDGGDEGGRPQRCPGELALLAALSGDRARLAELLPVALAEGEAVAGADRSPAALASLARSRRAVLEELDPRGARRERPGPYWGFVGPASDADGRRKRAPFVTVLENTARCPWQTFLSRFLHLRSLPDSLDALPSALDPPRIGSVVHAVLQELVRQQHPARSASFEALQALAPVPVRWPEPDALEALAQRCAEQVVREEGIGLPAFARVLARRALPLLEVARRLEWSTPDESPPVLGVEIEAAVSVQDAQGRQRVIRFQADRVDRVDGRLRLTDYKTGRPLSALKKPESRRRELLEAIAKGRALQGMAYARAAASGGLAAEGRYLYLGGESSDALRELSCTSDDSEAGSRFEAGLQALLALWDEGAFFPRLREPDRDEEPPACRLCAFKEACLRGDSGARLRLAGWVDRWRDASDPRLTPAERALLGVWHLGSAEASGRGTG